MDFLVKKSFLILIVATFFICVTNGNAQICDCPDTIDAGNGTDAKNPQIGLVGDGTAYGTFDQEDSTGEKRVYAIYFDGSSWDTVVIVDDPAGGKAEKPEIEVNSGGTALLVFQQKISGKERTTVTFNNGSGWTTPQIVDAGTGNKAEKHQLAYSDSISL